MQLSFEQEMKQSMNALTKKVDEIDTDIKDKESKKYLNCEFYEINGKDTFVKVKSNPFNIGKMQFAFVQFDKDSGKLSTSMDVFMNISDALLFANDILSGRIPALAANEKAKGAQYPQPVWKSTLGGVNEEKAKERGLRTDGKAISRLFTLSPGSRQPFVFTAEQRPGNTDDKGLIVPEYKGKPEIQIRVPCSDEDLKKLALEIQSHVQAYRAAQYANKEVYAAPGNFNK